MIIIDSKSFTDSNTRAFDFQILIFGALCSVCRTKYKARLAAKQGASGVLWVAVGHDKV